MSTKKRPFEDSPELAQLVAELGISRNLNVRFLAPATEGAPRQVASISGQNSAGEWIHWGMPAETEGQPFFLCF